MVEGLLFYRPFEYFRLFESRGARLWVALGAFLVSGVAMAASTGTLPPLDGPLSTLAWIILNWAFGIAFVGILWFFVGARILGGKATVAMTVKAVGYAVLVPGLVALALSVFTADLGEQAGSAPIRIVAIKLGLGLYSLYLAGIAVKYTHALTWPRAVLVVVWMPALWLAVAAGIVLGVPFFTMRRVV